MLTSNALLCKIYSYSDNKITVFDIILSFKHWLLLNLEDLSSQSCQYFKMLQSFHTVSFLNDNYWSLSYFLRQFYASLVKEILLWYVQLLISSGDCTPVSNVI